MPTFGDYETIGDPLASTDGSGHFSQLWLARKGGGEGPSVALKIYLPLRARRPTASEDQPEEDRVEQFVEGVKQIQKIRAEDPVAGSTLMPLHDFGKTADGGGAWYITDFYGEPDPFQPASLHSIITRGPRPDGEALRNIVYNIATACLALQRARGFSHGNIKSSNVFRVSKDAPLARAQIYLADAFPGAAAQLEGVDAEVGQLLQQTMEAHDLRAIGLLILQLVEGRSINTERGLRYPVENSPAWDALGRDGQHWREVCNRLLDPSLSIEQCNLQTLIKECRPGTVNKPMIAGAAALVCLIALGGYLLLASQKKGRATNPREEQASGRPAGALQITEEPQDQTNYIGNNAILWVNAAGNGHLKYQWSFNGKKKSGATGRSLTLTSLRPSDAGTYTVAISDGTGGVNSRSAVLTVLAAMAFPQITGQPQNQTIASPAGVVLSVTAAGPPPLKYQWRFNGAAISGATSQKLAVTAPGNYDVQVFNDGGSVNSRVAVVSGQPVASKDLDSQLQAAQQALNGATGPAATNLVWALARVNSVLAASPADEVAGKLRNKILDAIAAAVTDTLQKGSQALARTNLDQAMQNRNFAAYLKPDDPRLAQFSSGLFNLALFAATNSIEGATVNLDDAEHYWKILQGISRSGNETEHVKALIDAFDIQINEAMKSCQAMIDAPLKSVADATNLVNTQNGAGVFAWRPSRTNATSKLISLMEQKRLAGLQSGFAEATNALAGGNVPIARNRLEFIRALDPADARVSTLEKMIIASVGANPAQSAQKEK
jgi:hypothetical protein